MSQHFKEFFVCPHCRKPVVSRDNFDRHLKEKFQYCLKCGEKIADALAEAQAEINTEEEKSNVLTHSC